MGDDSIAQKVDRSLVAEIVSSYVAQNSVGVDQLASLITTVHRTLSGLGESTPIPVPGTHLAAISAFEANDMIALHRSPDWDRRLQRTGGISRPLEVVS
jgi:predicted transcriptional regulator